MLSRTTFKESLRTNGLIYILMLTIFVPSLLGRVYGMGWHVRRMVDKPLKIHGYYSPVAPYLFISEYLTDTDIVFVNAEEGWVIPALTGAKIIEPLHSSPTIGEEILDRKRDVAQFFYHHLTLEERQTMIAKYGATHIMVNLINKDQWDLSFKNDLNLLGREEVRENKIILYKIASER